MRGLRGEADADADILTISDYPLWAIFVVSLLALLGACEAGYRYGIRAAGRGGDSVATLEAAVLGLLALMISFTFSMALSRFDARRDALLNEANAIGTTALRARLLPAPLAGEGLKLLREYIQIRIDLGQRLASRQELDAALARSSAIQAQLWQVAKAAARDPSMVPTGLFINTLNEMIDNQEKRLTAARNRVPNIVFLALYGIALIAAAFIGYDRGLQASRSRLPVVVMAVLLGAVILLIQDLDRSSHGFITVNQQPMLDTAASLAGYPE